MQGLYKSLLFILFTSAIATSVKVVPLDMIYNQTRAISPPDTDKPLQGLFTLFASELPAFVSLAGSQGSSVGAVSSDRESAPQQADTGETHSSLKKQYRVARCGSAGDTYCSNTCVSCDSSGRLVKKEGFDRHQGCPPCLECSCVS